MIFLAIGQFQPGIFYLQKITNFKKYTLFIKPPLLLNLPQFYVPGNNPNLKNELIWKTPFFFEKQRPLPHHRAQRPNRTQKNS